MNKKFFGINCLTDDLDIVGHPTKGDPFLNKSFESLWSKDHVTCEENVEFRNAAEEKGGKGGREQGQVFAESLLQRLVVIPALEDLLKGFLRGGWSRLDRPSPS